MPQALCHMLGDTDKNILLTVPLYPPLTTCINILLSYPLKHFLGGESSNTSKQPLHFKNICSMENHQDVGLESQGSYSVRAVIFKLVKRRIICYTFKYNAESQVPSPRYSSTIDVWYDSVLCITF
jgi:hypothetical protein